MFINYRLKEILLPSNQECAVLASGVYFLLFPFMVYSFMWIMLFFRRTIFSNSVISLVGI